MARKHFYGQGPVESANQPEEASLGDVTGNGPTLIYYDS
jgi:hypothetical protein